MLRPQPCLDIAVHDQEHTHGAGKDADRIARLRVCAPSDLSSSQRTTVSPILHPSLNPAEKRVTEGASFDSIGNESSTGLSVDLVVSTQEFPCLTSSKSRLKFVMRRP